MQVVTIDDRGILLDDNVTARWALLWSHGIAATHHLRGWTFAHVWPAVKDPQSYTHVVNLAMIPESFGSLTDKAGPLCGYLRYHALCVYGWKPEGENEPPKPEAFDEIEWRYFEAISDPHQFVAERCAGLTNRRLEAMRGFGWLPGGAIT